MPVEVGGRPEAFIADVAHVVPLVGVAPHVYCQRVFPGERLAAVLTPMWPEKGEECYRKLGSAEAHNI